MTSGPDFGSADDEASRLTRFIGEVGIWSVDPYQRCSFRCVYCIADSQGESTPRHSAGRVVAALRRDLEAVPPEAELFIGATADAYPPVERELGLTRLVLAEVSRQGRPFCVATKGTLVLRDIDILRDHGGHCDVYLSLVTSTTRHFDNWSRGRRRRVNASTRSAPCTTPASTSTSMPRRGFRE